MSGNDLIAVGSAVFGFFAGYALCDLLHRWERRSERRDDPARWPDG